jgi:hypothetical protein
MVRGDGGKSMKRWVDRSNVKVSREDYLPRPPVCETESSLKYPFLFPSTARPLTPPKSVVLCCVAFPSATFVYPATSHDTRGSRQAKQHSRAYITLGMCSRLHASCKSHCTKWRLMQQPRPVHDTNALVRMLYVVCTE